MPDPTHPPFTDVKYFGLDIRAYFALEMMKSMIASLDSRASFAAISEYRSTMAETAIILANTLIDELNDYDRKHPVGSNP